MPPAKKADEAKTAAANKNMDELTATLEDMLGTLSTKFDGVSKELFAKMDEMSRRLDNLETALRASEERTNETTKS
ncbi:hypothetical protein GGR52DRAFT_573745 [Hypoxylon sp. FL1284]|nr:hypothetical protein GGR52DRAFT_577434 [Hypoxylon sp. FL1284]KAI0169690.1 hypothetical protein GGR52DRAFT_573745 [Hypoxylon sp. FL1284]